MGQRLIAPKQPRGRGRPRKSLPNKTELKVLDQIAQEGFQNFSELLAGCLQGFHRRHSGRVLRQMARAGLLLEARADNGGILGWSIQPRSAIRSLDFNPLTPDKKRRSPVYRTSYIHDAKLRHIKRILSACPAIVKWVPEHLLKSEVMHGARFLGLQERTDRLTLVPDALLHLRCRGVDSKAALELELSLKSRKRLTKKFEAYITSDQFDYAFFIASTPALSATLRQVCDEVTATSWRVKLSKHKNGIYFTTLEQLLAQGIRAPFTASHDTLCFAQLAP